jgi:hypothetical protein
MKRTMSRILFCLVISLSIYGMELMANDGFINLIQSRKNKKSKEVKFNKHGWNHYGPGYFELDEKNGILETKKGMGLFWNVKKVKNFVLEFDFKVDQAKANSGIFIRVPEIPLNNSYITKTFEVQICDVGKDADRLTGALYSAKAPDKKAVTKAVGEWNHYKITCQGKNIKIELNGELINDWDMKPAGKVKEFALEGYIGFQNHDYDTKTFYKDIKLKELD